VKIANANEWICLGSKSYAYKNDSGNYHQTAKGLIY
jgi:hypothetical protein